MNLQPFSICSLELVCAVCLISWPTVRILPNGRRHRTSIQNLRCCAHDQAPHQVHLRHRSQEAPASHLQRSMKQLHRGFIKHVIVLSVNTFGSFDMQYIRFGPLGAQGVFTHAWVASLHFLLLISSLALVSCTHLVFVPQMCLRDI